MICFGKRERDGPTRARECNIKESSFIILILRVFEGAIDQMRTKMRALPSALPRAFVRIHDKDMIKFKPFRLVGTHETHARTLFGRLCLKSFLVLAQCFEVTQESHERIIGLACGERLEFVVKSINGAEPRAPFRFRQKLRQKTGLADNVFDQGQDVPILHPDMPIMESFIYRHKHFRARNADLP